MPPRRAALEQLAKNQRHCPGKGDDQHGGPEPGAVYVGADEASYGQPEQDPWEQPTS
ncbi:hypothetical protein [Candidatus Poriferisocius sp.]|uniref:hypothetical protein n=1 Tax=Candidatus Poriferisocius sp. TaxID=3101276 RepID=UPI003B02A7B7